MSTALVFAQGNWLRSMGSSFNEEARDVTFDSNGDVVFCGYFLNALNTGVGTLNSAGNTDILVVKTNDAGDPIWAVSAGGTLADQANAIAADAQGNTYITGYFQDAATFGGINVTGNGWEAYVAKIDVNGNFVWVTTFGGANGDIGHGIDVDNNGNIICVGEYEGTATFGPDVLVSMINPLTSAPSIDIFITKLDNSGNFLWTQDGKAEKDDKAFSVTTDNSGNIYVVGQFSDDLTFDNFHPSTLLNAGFIVAFDQNGNEQWFDRMWGTQVLITDVEWRSNNIFICGDFQNNLLFEDINNTQNYPGPMQYNIFVSSIASNGDVNWFSNNYSENELHARQICSDGSNDVYITGDFKCTFTEMNQIYGNSTFLSLGFDDVHYIKYSNNGTFQWGQQMASDRADFGLSCAIKNADKPIIVGTHQSTFYVPAGSTFSYQAGQPSQLGVTNCGDATYADYAKESTAGARDIFWTSPYDPSRLPMDWFQKDPGISCDLDIHPPCAGNLVPFAGCEDTLSDCAPVLANLNNFMLAVPQPDFSISWSNGGNTFATNYTNGGNQSVTVTTVDGCYSWTDDFYIDLYPDPPNVAEISDSWGYNDYFINPVPIDTCAADSVFAWATSTGPSTDSIVWVDMPHLNDSTIVIDTSGLYPVIIINEYGCVSDTNYLSVFIQPLDPQATLDPVIVVNDQSIIDTDSVLVCGLPFCSDAFVIDSAFIMQYGQMPGLDVLWWLDGVFIDTITTDKFDSIPWSNNNLMSFCVMDTGWHTLDVHIINECADSIDYFVSTSFYVDTVGYPFLEITKPPACPGDTITIVATYYTDTIYWSGSSIVNNWVDSVQAVYDEVGGLNVLVNVDTTVDGVTCPTSDAYILPAIPLPQLFMDPPDGIVCPGDSVLITALGGTSWQWIGPNGDSLGTNQTQWASATGDYFAYVTTGSCSIPSEFVTVNAFSSPQLSAWNPVICFGDTATIQVLGPTNTVINWLPPLSGSDSIVQVTNAGWYYAELTFCGVTEIDSVEITYNDPLAGFSMPNDTTICPYDSIVVQAPAGMSEYLWNGVPGIDSYTILDSGFYWLEVVDQTGCADTSDTVYVQFHALPNPPLATDTTVCIGGDATLNAQGTGVIEWYDFNWNFEQTGNPFIVNNVIFAVNYLVTQTDAFCTSIPDTATIAIYPDNLTAAFTILDNCGSLTVQVQNSGSQGMLYDWDMGDLTVYNNALDTMNHTYAGNGTYTITQIVSHPICNYADTTSNSVTVYGQSINPTWNEPTCFGFNDASLTLNVVNAVGNEIFLIQDALGATLNIGGSNTANNLVSAWYYWSVELGPGCILEDSVFIDQPGPLSGNINVFPPPCNGMTGQATIDTVFNWQGDYNNISFFWNPNTSGVGGLWADSTWNMPAGNYTLTINDDNGCSNVLDFTVTEPPALIFTQLGSEPAYCRLFDYQIGNGVVFAAASGGTPDYDYQWCLIGDTICTPSTTWGGLNPGDYQITVTDNNGCTLTEIITVDEVDPIADFDMTSVDFDVEWEGDAPLEVTFTNLSQYYANPNNPNADTTFFWHFDHPNDPPGWVISHDVNETFDTVYTAGTYTICLVAINKNGCSDTLCQEIVVHDSVALEPVNVFTPDGDGANDVFTFEFVHQGIDEFHCIIVNRWGVTIKELNTIHEGWDGTDKNGDDVPAGVYFYVYEGVGFNGTQFGGQGTVTLIRRN